MRKHLNGVTLETILNELVIAYGWVELSQFVKIRCFYNEPSIKSSLKFFTQNTVGKKWSWNAVLRLQRKKQWIVK